MEGRYQERSLNEAAERYFHCCDESALEDVINSATGLIHYFCRLYGKANDDEDLFQAGNLGLMKAIKNYKSDKGVTFVTYASHCVIGEIRHWVRKQASFYRPGCIVELQSKINRVIEEYSKINGTFPSVSYVADKINVAEDGIGEVMKAGLVSFEEIDRVKIHSQSYESFKLPIEDKLILSQAMNKLNMLQKKVIFMIFYQDMSQQKIANQLGINQKKVSRIKEDSIKILRKYLRE